MNLHGSDAMRYLSNACPRTSLSLVDNYTNIFQLFNLEKKGWEPQALQFIKNMCINRSSKTINFQAKNEKNKIFDCFRENKKQQKKYNICFVQVFMEAHKWENIKT